MRPTHIALAALLAAGPAAAQPLYKCVVDGKTSYQSEPCSGKATQSELRAPAPRAAPEPEPAKAEEAKAAAPDKPKAASRVTREEMEMVVDTMVGYTVCNEADPGFGAKLSMGFEGWRERNAALLDRFNQDPEGPVLMQRRLEAERARQQADPDSARAARIENCVRTASRIKPTRPETQ